MQTSVAIEFVNKDEFVPTSITAIDGGVSAETTGIPAITRVAKTAARMIFFICFLLSLGFQFVDLCEPCARLSADAQRVQVLETWLFAAHQKLVSKPVLDASSSGFQGPKDPWANY